MPLQQELKIFIKSEKHFLFIFFAFLLVAVPSAYYSIPYFPWETHPLLAIFILAGLGIVFIIDRLFVPVRLIRKVEVFEILITVLAVFGISLVTGSIYSPLNIFYFVPIAFAFFIINRNFGFRVFGLVVILLLIEVFLKVWPEFSFRNLAILTPYFPFLLSYLIGLVYVVAIILLISGTFKNVERERSVAEEKAKYLQKLLENLRELDNEKTKFISNIAHHFRTPISIFKWSLESVMGKKPNRLSEDQKKLMQEMYKANDNLIVLLHKILTVSKWDLRQVEYKEVNLSSILEQITERWQVIADQEKIEIKTVIPKNLMVEVNEEGIKEVIDVVLENAIFYNKPGGRVEMEVQEEKDRINITIKDTGIGIPKNEQKMLFTAFFRADNVRNKEAGVRKGLDLFIAQKIIRGHGGEIKIESQENRGTNVFIYFSKKQKKNSLIS